MRPKVKLLVTVWGESYINQFTSLALPSFLAPGNLPALAKATDLEVMVLTSANSVSIFNQKASFRYLSRICGVRFIEIDDLITNGVYGVTLTLGYARGVMDSGDDMLKTHFVFMNSDFVLADGSLNNLAKRILNGQSIIVAPSFRAVAEDVEPQLLAEVDQASSALTIPPRRLVDVALKHMHPTTIAKIVNQEFCHSIEPNQFFWQVDEHTMIARFYLIFMLCLKPERVISKINSFCDYGFVPQFCPSGNMVVMDDSDEFFMLELSKRTQENFLLRLGSQSMSDITRSLSSWATREHRLFAKFNLLFHAKDLGSETEKIKTNAEEFIAKIERRLSEPISHAYHHYWVRGVHGWQRLRREQSLSSLAAEIDIPAKIDDVPRDYAIHLSLLNRLRPLLMGARPYLRPWHQDWYDFRDLRRHLRRILGRNDATVLFISDGDSPIEQAFPLEDSRIARINTRSLLTSSSQQWHVEHGKFTHVFCYLPRKDLLSLARIVDQVLPGIAKHGEMLIFVENTGVEYEYINFSRELIENSSYILPAKLYATSVSFSGGFLKHLIRDSKSLLWAFLNQHKLKSLILFAPAMTFLVGLATLNNLYQIIARRHNRSVNYCSSFLMHIKL